MRHGGVVIESSVIELIISWQPAAASSEQRTSSSAKRSIDRMTWCNGFNDVRAAVDNPAGVVTAAGKKEAASLAVLVKMCPSCGYRAQYGQVRRKC
jgi:hypothetical protein